VDTQPVRHLLGRRGAALLIIGIIWILEGVSDLLHHPGSVPGYWLYSHTPWWLQAAGWIITGLGACHQAFRAQGRDAPGWVAVQVMAIYALAVYADAAVEAIGTPRLTDVALSGIRNVAFVGLIFVMAGWREPIRFGGGGEGDQ